MTSNYDNTNNNFNTGAHSYPSQNTNTGGIASHIPGTEAHAQRSNSPGAKMMSKIPGTAEHKHEKYGDEHYTGNDGGQGFHNTTTGTTTTGGVASHIPGTESHARHSNSPGAKVASMIPGTAEHQHEKYGNDHYTGGQGGQGFRNTNTTTGGNAASHIPGTESHAQRSNSPGAKIASKIPGTAEHKHEKYGNEHYTGADNAANRHTGNTYDNTNTGGIETFRNGNTTMATDNLSSTGRGGAGNIIGATDNSSLANPVGHPVTGRNDPILGDHHGTHKDTKQHQGDYDSARDAHRNVKPSVGDKIIGSIETAIGKATHNQGMIDKGIEKKTVGTNHGVPYDARTNPAHSEHGTHGTTHTGPHTGVHTGANTHNKDHTGDAMYPHA